MKGGIEGDDLQVALRLVRRKLTKVERRIVIASNTIGFAAMPFAFFFAATGRYLDSGNIPGLVVTASFATLTLVERRRYRDAASPPPTPSGTVLLTRLGALLAAEQSRADEWIQHLADLRTEGRRVQILAALGYMRAGLQSRYEWLIRTAVIPLLRWILVSNVRTWSPVAVAVGWAVNDVAQTSRGSAVLALVAFSTACVKGVNWLRDKLDAGPPKKKKESA